jgi:hypothetical protein
MKEKLKYLWEIADEVYPEEGDDEVRSFEDFSKMLDEGKTMIVNVNDELYYKVIKRDEDNIDFERNELYCWRWCKNELKLSQLEI